MVHISEISYKNRKNCTYLYDFDHEKTTITTGYLKKTQDGLQILALRGFRNRSGRNFSRRDFKMPAFLFLRICKDFSCKSSSMKSVLERQCSFSSLGTTQQNNCKCAQLLRFSISFKCKYLHWMLVSVRL